MAPTTDIIRYRDADTTCHGLLAIDESRGRPKSVVLIVHAWEGRNQFVADKAIALAKLGYAGFAVDMYGEGRTGATPAEREALMLPILENRQLLTRRITAAYDTVREERRLRGVPIVVMGYCFGGICALDLARSGVDIAGAVTFHGGLKPTGFPNGDIKASILMFHADKDKFVPLEDFLSIRDELNAAGARWQAHVYGGVLHSFTNPDERDPSSGMAYDEAAATHAWGEFVSFLDGIVA